MLRLRFARGEEDAKETSSECSESEAKKTRAWPVPPGSVCARVVEEPLSHLLAEVEVRQDPDPERLGERRRLEAQSVRVGFLGHSSKGGAVGGGCSGSG